MLTLHHGNRLERLADVLAGLLRTPLGGPLDAETVVVPNAGMARWLALRIADANGVCAGVRFRLPGAFFWETFRTVVPALPEASAFDPAVVTWRIAALLDRLDPADARFAPLGAYVAARLDDADGDRRRFDLARRLADLYEQYLVYRPHWILDWEDGGDDHWQAELWRQIVAATDRRHRARLQRQVEAAVAAGDPALQRLPPRLSVFGLPALPPADLWLLQVLGQVVPVDVFLLNPCAEFPDGVRTPKQLAWVARSRDVEALHLEVGNPLYASLGRQGREFFELLFDRCQEHDDHFVEPDVSSLLGCLQSDILHLRCPGTKGLPRRRLAAGDRSVQLHACHSPMREVEVLHDQLLALFAERPDLLPSDVVVMTPDIATYAPCIEAVFGTVPRERQIRFTIADRSLRAEHGVVEAFFGLLELGHGRCEVDRLLGLLESTAVRRRFGLREADLEDVHAWVREAGIRWGADAQARAAAGLPATPDHTWRLGLDRLLVGYALPGEGRRFVSDGHDDLLPCDEVEGTAARALGALARFADAAAALAADLAVRRPVAAWADTLAKVLADFCDPDDADEAGARAILHEIDAMAEAAARAGHVDPVGLALVLAHLRDALDRGELPGRFLAGAVTVCAMVPMRSIPFEVVCLLGLDVASFPRTRRPPPWDRMAETPCFGDRARRDDDRTLFLEALLSARHRLHVSWVGKGIRDNKTIQPSVLVTELLDHVEAAFEPPAGVDSVRAYLQVEHPLQPFSEEYFRPDGDPRLFSFSLALCDASRALGGTATPPSPVLTSRLPALPDGVRTVDVEQLAEFFAHPARQLLRQRLGLWVDDDDRPLEPREPFVLEGLERWKVDQHLLEARLAGQPASAVERVLRARGALPHGRVGDAVLRERQAETADLAARVEREAGTRPPGTIDGIDLRLGDFRLTGTLRQVGPRGIVGWRAATVKPKDRLRLWVRHLVLLAARRPPNPMSVWLGSGRDDRKDEVRFGAVADPLAVLDHLVELYWRGMHELLPFTPRASRAWVEADDDASRPAAALDAWVGGRERGEGEDVWFRAAWRSTLPFESPGFDQVATAVYGPLRCAETSQS